MTADAFKTCAQRYAEMRDTSAARALTFQGSAVLWWMCGVENTQQSKAGKGGDGREPPGFVPVELWGCTTSGGLVLSQNSKFQIMVMVVVINM